MNMLLTIVSYLLLIHSILALHVHKHDIKSSKLFMARDTRDNLIKHSNYDKSALITSLKFIGSIGTVLTSIEAANAAKGISYII